VIVNGYQGTHYPGPQSERNALFRPLVTATVVQVLGREFEFSVHGRNGEVKRGTLPPVEVRFVEGADSAEAFRKDGSFASIFLFVYDIGYTVCSTFFMFVRFC
jgi:hypothetical protein